MSLSEIELTYERQTGVEWVINTLRNIPSQHIIEITINHLARDDPPGSTGRARLDSLLAESPVFIGLQRVVYRVYCNGVQNEDAWDADICASLPRCKERGILEVSLHECKHSSTSYVFLFILTVCIQMSEPSGTNRSDRCMSYTVERCPVTTSSFV